MLHLEGKGAQRGAKVGGRLGGSRRAVGRPLGGDNTGGRLLPHGTGS